MKPFSEEKRIKDKKRYCFVPRRIRPTENPIVIYKHVGITDQNYDRIKQYAKTHNLTFSGSFNKLMDLAEITHVAPKLALPQLKPLHEYESFSLNPKPKRKYNASAMSPPP
jgi:hypothetical protein